MPTLPQVRLPLPTGWDEFEDIVVSAIAAGNPSSPPQRFGRPGQKQYGVDIYFEDDTSRRTGVQCKLVSAFTIEEVEAEIEKAETFKPELECYMLALGTQRDARLQKLVYQLCARRAVSDKFRVGLWFWEDIAFALSRDAAETARHYPQFFIGTSAPSVFRDTIRTELAKLRFAAYQELWLFRRRCLPPKRYPDMEWGEALEEIALDFDNHAKALEEMVQRLGPILPVRTSDELSAAAGFASDGIFEVTLTNPPTVTTDGQSAAEKMYDALDRALSELRTSLKRDGVRFD